MRLWRTRLRSIAPFLLLLTFLGSVLLISAGIAQAPHLESAGGASGDSAAATAADAFSSDTLLVVDDAVFQQTLEVFGTLAPSVTVSVSVDAGGVVAAVHVEAGDQVEAGALLAELHDERLGISLQQAELGLVLSKQELELARMRLNDGERVVEAALLEIEQAQLELTQRESEREEMEHQVYLATELHKVGGRTDGELRATETELRNAGTRLELARRRLAAVEIGYRERDLRDAGIAVPADTTQYAAAFLVLHTRRLEHELSSTESRVAAAELELRRAQLSQQDSLIHSPISGVIGDRFLITGERVSVGDRAFTVLSLDALDFVGELGEDKQAQLELGATAEIFTARGGELIGHGRVSRAAPYLDPSRRSRSLRVRLEEPAGEAAPHRPGLLARALISAGVPEVYLRVSEQALHQGVPGSSRAGTRVYLRILRGGELVTTPVRPVQISNGQVLFEGDVQVGEQAVVRGAGDTYVGR